MKKLTPMLQQWADAKKRAQDAILLFRMGDFYELFADDALKAAPLLELAITSRDKEKAESSMPMAGFPHHAAPAYIAKLVSLGFKVAICEQLEDPKLAKGIVKRDITRIVTPGTVLDDDGLSPKANNYLVGIAWNKTYGLAAIDLSTGDFFATSTEHEDALLDEISRLQPAELLLADQDWSEDFLHRAEQTVNLNRTCRLEKYSTSSKNHLALKQLGTLDDWFLADNNAIAIHCAELILAYVEATQGGVAAHIASPRPYSIDAQLMIDATSRAHLDLIGPPQEMKRAGTLLWVLDKTCTAMGGRQLTRWLLAPSTDLSTIQQRHDVIDVLLEDPGLRVGIREILRQIYDFERLTSKITSGRVNPRELAQLRNSLAQLPALQQLVAAHVSMHIQQMFSAEDVLSDVYHLLETALACDPPIAMKDGGIFTTGYDSLLDELVKLSSGGREQIAAIEQREKEATGITSLKVKYTRVFGYYIEITKSHLAKVPDHYRRKQTVTGGERYVTVELMRLEELVTSAEVRRQHREAELFEALRLGISAHARRLLKTAALVARLDTLCAFAELADERRYVRPKMLLAQTRCIDIVDGRHPIIEVLSEGRGEPFVPNSIQLDADERQLLMITGPNMAGKSTIMRQVGLIQLLAQAGSFVPAKSANLSVCDRIFTRVGAADDLRQGRSTFMVEMSETAHILKHATPFSLVLFDEIGRGTSTFDGLSLAWAVAEHLHNHIGACTLFATHYHELVALADELPRVRNMQVMVREANDTITFLYSLAEGAAEQSYGIHVARLAGLPPTVLVRANEILETLEEKKMVVTTPPSTPLKPQLDLFSRPLFDESAVKNLLASIENIDVNRTSPLDALIHLAKLQSAAKNLTDSA